MPISSSGWILQQQRLMLVLQDGFILDWDFNYISLQLRRLRFLH
uniref:Uncharacterized protein n=1 Tax=Populus trichocarpa x Populus deltoides TaxID=3695 RepID=A9PK24_9ROSI|nr:unknown [Populus trichocarpa x Populus deltoides]